MSSQCWCSCANGGEGGCERWRRRNATGGLRLVTHADEAAVRVEAEAASAGLAPLSHLGRRRRRSGPRPPSRVHFRADRFVRGARIFRTITFYFDFLFGLC